MFKGEPHKVGINGECCNHKLEILNFLLLVLLRKHCASPIKKGSSKERKLKILSNE